MTPAPTPSSTARSKNESLLLIRFSALGDILMTVPVIDALARRFPDLKITVVSRPFVKSIFQQLPENVEFVGINPRQYGGLSGLNKMYKELKALHPTYVCDLHDVLRTKYLRLRFKWAGVPVSHIVKDRKARKTFLKAEQKVQQETSFERYAKALQQLDFMQGIDFVKEISEASRQAYPAPIHIKAEAVADGSTALEERQKRVGIAPFAAHKGKIYPLNLMERVVSLLSKKGVKVYLFGAGEKEREQMEDWANKYEYAENMVGALPSMADEMKLIDSLDVMLTMDSGNMHLASLTKTPVFSIWGATHPLGGFMGWKQTADRCIQLDMPCRPCSIFGNKPCRLGDYPCLKNIKPEDIVNKLL